MDDAQHKRKYLQDKAEESEDREWLDGVSAALTAVWPVVDCWLLGTKEGRVGGCA
jgi:hypothetical protein